MPRDDGIELARHACAGKRGVGDERQAFARAVIDDRQNAEPSAIGEAVRHEIERPALVRAGRAGDRGPHAHRPLPATALAHGQAFLSVEPPEPLLVHVHALPAEKKMQPPIAEPAPARDTEVLTKLVNRWPASRIDDLMPWAYAAKFA
jgi:hypothetical protein